MMAFLENLREKLFGRREAPDIQKAKRQMEQDIDRLASFFQSPQAQRLPENQFKEVRGLAETAAKHLPKNPLKQIDWSSVKPADLTNQGGNQASDESVRGVLGIIVASLISQLSKIAPESLKGINPTNLPVSFDLKDSLGGMILGMMGKSIEQATKRASDTPPARPPIPEPPPIPRQTVSLGRPPEEKPTLPDTTLYPPPIPKKLLPDTTLFPPPIPPKPLPDTTLFPPPIPTPPAAPPLPTSSLPTPFPVFPPPLPYPLTPPPLPPKSPLPPSPPTPTPPAPAGAGGPPNVFDINQFVDAFGKAFRQGSGRGIAGMLENFHDMRRFAGTGGVVRSLGIGLGKLLPGRLKAPFKAALSKTPFGGLGGMLGKTATGVTEFVTAIAKATNYTLEWAGELHRANMQFAEFSASMAGVQARQEVRDIQLSKQRGDRRAESAEFLAESMTDLKQTWSVIEDGLAILTNYIVGGLAETLDSILNVLTLGLLKKDKMDKNTMGDMLFRSTEQRQRDWLNRHGQPARFRKD